MSRTLQHTHSHPIREAVDYSAANLLGVASIAIGLTEILAPKALEKTMGIKKDAENTGILRVLGIREIATGFDILTHKDPVPGIWGRVIGDLLDGLLLGMVAKKSRNLGGFSMILSLVTPVVLADMLFAPRLSKDKARHR